MDGKDGKDGHARVTAREQPGYGKRVAVPARSAASRRRR
jgi:hypothetical protein